MSKVQMEKQREFTDFTYIPNMMFKSLGYDFLDTPKPWWQKLLLRSYFALCLFSVTYISSYMFKRIIEWDTLAGNTSVIMRIAELLFFLLNIYVKFFVMAFYRNDIHSLRRKLYAIYPSDDAQRQTYQVNEFYWSKAARYIFICYYMGSLMLVFGPITQSIGIYVYRLTYLNATEAKFPYLRCFPVQLGFETNTPLFYAIVQILEISFSHFVINVNVGTDLWIMCLAAQISMHFAYLGRLLNAHCPSRLQERSDCEFLARLVGQQQHLLRLYKKLNDIFGLLLAYNLLSTANILCFVAFYTLVQGFNLEGLSSLLYLCSAAAQFYMLCSSGQQLSDTNKSIGLAAYMHNWYDGTPVYRKYILLLLVQANRPVILSAKGVVEISLETFKSMATITYRIFAVVRTVLDK